MKTQDSRTKKWTVFVPVIIVVLVVGWYWFRPERLVTNRRVNEAFPGINDSQTQILESGTFHSGTHPTEGTATTKDFFTAKITPKREVRSESQGYRHRTEAI